MEDVVYLKNGGVTRGELLEIVPGITIKIRTVDRNIFVYNFDEVLKVVKEPIPIQKDPVKEPVQVVDNTPIPIENKASSIVYKQEGFHNITKFGPLGLSGYSINFINGYQFNPHLLLGLGVGLDVYKGLEEVNLDFANSTTDYFLPIYVDFRYHVSKSRATFFMFMNMGYSVYLDGDGRVPVINNSTSYYSYEIPDDGGTFFCPGIGCKVFLNKKVGVLLDFGFKIQSYGATVYSNTYNPYSGGPAYSATQSHEMKSSVSPMLNFGFAF
jgi:hypothetical protein